MLVLTRKSQQQIQIGDAITITILRVKGRTVRVGVEAPREVNVARSEVAHRPKTAKASAGGREARPGGGEGGSQPECAVGARKCGGPLVATSSRGPVAGRSPLSRPARRLGPAPLAGGTLSDHLAAIVEVVGR